MSGGWDPKYAERPDLSFYEHVLANIANDCWNVGRRSPITVQEYAAQAIAGAVPASLAGAVPGETQR